MSIKSETFLDGRVTQYVGDVREVLKFLPPDHFDCVVTSPPYWGLRDYGVVGQLGLEPSLGEHIETMVSVFEEVKRVLKPMGTLWLNYGDCYATSPNGRSAADTKAAGDDDRTFRDKPFSTIGPIFDPDYRSRTTGGIHAERREDAKGRVFSGGYLKPKDLCMIPNRIAISLQEAGWWVRSEIIWHKPNPMPESVTDRPATSHEKIWMLTKSQRYFYNAEAVRRPAADVSVDRIKYPRTPKSKWFSRDSNSTDIRGSDGARLKKDKQRGHGRRHQGFNERWDAMPKEEQSEYGAHLRNVWEIATSPFPEAHFATFPEGLVVPCILAGCPDSGLILDPFGGSGTVALVAASLGRRSSLIELNPEYATMARARIESSFMGDDEGKRHMVKQLGKLALDAGPLFDAIS